MNNPACLISDTISLACQFDELYLKKCLNLHRENGIMFIKSQEELETVKAVISNKSKNTLSPLNKDSVVCNLLSKYNLFDKSVNDYISENNITLICKNGCHSCCSDYFYFSLIEYFTIKQSLIEKGEFLRIKEKAKIQYEKLKKDHFDEYKKLANADEIFTMFQDKNYLEKFETCVLLGKNNECVCYNERPFICRMFGTTLDQPLCKKIQDNSNLSGHIIQHKTSPMQTREENDIFTYNGKQIITKPYPLIYWLSCDDDYAEAYNIATKESKKKFIDYIAIRNGLAPKSIFFCHN